ncbi:MbtH family NRPS accessory protein [Nisaea acidiphila]|uniref:MbtH family NRPS accessory protein n=1 Tax=Nisaea acidiphila TaxID=1862145 RepID=A0A9J7APE2_9PROT|nr:MbtH family NRPS accessory protein [Nisaea acidiphila]UUX48465.1 MbtH family NRPS accessory protein [Nisaea acidiphila]
MSETSPGQTDTPAATHQVLVNEEEQYCVWPAGKPVPAGWESVFSGTHEACTAHVEEVWTDMRPKSVRG